MFSITTACKKTPGCRGLVRDGMCDTCGPVATRSTGSTPCTIVAGPPGSGKTTYVGKRAKRGDLIVDVDALWVAVTGLDWYDKPHQLLSVVLSLRDTLIDSIRKGYPDIARAWLITSAATPAERARLADACGGANIIILEVTAEECLARIANDPRRKNNVAQWKSLVDKWWSEYWAEDDEQIVKE